MQMITTSEVTSENWGKGGTGQHEKEKKKVAKINCKKCLSGAFLMQKQQSLCMCASFFLAPKNAKKLFPPEKHCNRYITKLENKKKKRIVGTSSGFQFVEVRVNSKNPKRV
jgi:hypothetical protein